MSTEILNILISALGVIITGLATWGVTVFTNWVNSKIKDQKAANYISTVGTLVLNCVNEVTQTYVKSLKEAGTFDEAAQKEALEKCLNKVKTQLAPEIAEYITTNFGDLTSYLTTLIESTIYTEKTTAVTSTVSTSSGTTTTTTVTAEACDKAE